MAKKPDLRTDIATLRKNNDPIEILKFIKDNGCKFHYPLESVLLTSDFTFLDLINECVEANNVCPNWDNKEKECTD